MSGNPHKAAYNLMATARNGLAEELRAIRAYLRMQAPPDDAVIASITIALEEYGPRDSRNDF